MRTKAKFDDGAGGDAIFQEHSAIEAGIEAVGELWNSDSNLRGNCTLVKFGSGCGSDVEAAAKHNDSIGVVKTIWYDPRLRHATKRKRARRCCDSDHYHNDDKANPPDDLSPVIALSGRVFLRAYKGWHNASNLSSNDLTAQRGSTQMSDWTAVELFWIEHSRYAGNHFSALRNWHVVRTKCLRQYRERFPLIIAKE
jgi:hypothetical protein